MAAESHTISVSTCDHCSQVDRRRSARRWSFDDGVPVISSKMIMGDKGWKEGGMFMQRKCKAMPPKVANQEGAGKQGCEKAGIA
ncbi:MAG: hypothetical protein ALECFALPRED_001217 [Alectoria fallacina]|uniref:Uncharacterized protein n=1 Tax=Alectoria fallacina TaxID=1903189 RepID=A0A8H3F9L5_9LECA|nr:MAG: hypothetical protein ALECFALPRED_001217 [Alectoria fallacina]